MASKRSNPTQKAISQSVVNPVATPLNTDKGNPAGMKVPAGKSKTLHQSVKHPSKRPC